jgi:hypothetical protein
LKERATARRKFRKLFFATFLESPTEGPSRFSSAADKHECRQSAIAAGCFSKDEVDAMSDATKEDMAMLKRMRLVRKKLKEVPFSLRAQHARSAPACFPARPPAPRCLTAPPRLAAVQIARLEEIRASGERELNEDELTKLISGAAFREEVRARACVRTRLWARTQSSLRQLSAVPCA